MKLGIVTSNRADYSILRPLVKKLKKIKKFKTQLIVTGSHFSKKHGYTVKEILNDKVKIKNKIYTNLDNLHKTFSDTFIKFHNYLKKSKIKYLILLGDRYEILSVALSSFFLKIPIIHLHGGETTSGSIDNICRDLISKVSNIHLISNIKYKKKLLLLGVKKENIYLVGSLAIDNILYFKNKKSNLFKIKFIKNKNFKKNILVTFHPATLEKINYENQIKSLLKALNKFKEIGIVFTSTNIDPGSNKISRLIKDFISKNKNSIMIKSLGGEDYYSLIQKVDCVVGNSSSGIMEAPFLRTPTINIGNRQKGRLMSKSIINTNYNYNSIYSALKTILYKKKYYKYDFLYGKGGSTKKILNILNKLK